MRPERDDGALTPLQRALAVAIASAIVRQLQQEKAMTALDGTGIERPSQTDAERVAIPPGLKTEIRLLLAKTLVNDVLDDRKKPAVDTPMGIPKTQTTNEPGHR